MTALEAEKATVEKRLGALKAGKAKKITPEERAEVERAWKVSVGTAKRREVIAREMWKVIADVVPEREMREELRERFELDG